MSRLLTLDNAFSQEYPGVLGGSFTAVSARTGLCYRTASPVSGASQRSRAQIAASLSTGPFFVRDYFRYDTLPSAENCIMYFSNSATIGAGLMAYITIDNGGLLRLYDEDGQIGSASSALSSATYNRIEMEFNIAGAAGKHVVRARINGVEFAGANDRSISSGVNQYYHGCNLRLETQTTGDWRFDDTALNDGVGQFENSYPGDGAIFLLRPNAAGDNNAWTNDYTAVDETAPNDATDFQASNTLNAIIDHNLEDTPAGIGAGDTIKVVTANSRHNGASASAVASFVLRLKMAASGLIEESSPLTLISTTWRTNDISNVTLKPPLTLYDMPGPTGAYITKANLDTAQIGARISTANTNNAQITNLWLAVEASTVARQAPYSGDDMLLALM